MIINSTSNITVTENNTYEIIDGVTEGEYKLSNSQYFINKNVTPWAETGYMEAEVTSRGPINFNSISIKLDSTTYTCNLIDSTDNIYKYGGFNSTTEPYTFDWTTYPFALACDGTTCNIYFQDTSIYNIWIQIQANFEFKAYVVLIESYAKAKFRSVVPNYYLPNSTSEDRSDTSGYRWELMGLTNMVRQFESAADTPEVYLGINGDFISERTEDEVTEYFPRGAVKCEHFYSNNGGTGTTYEDEFYFGQLNEGSIDICNILDTYASNYLEAICGGSRILRNKSVVTLDNNDFAERSGIGIKTNGDILLITTENGITVLQLAQLMLASGCYTAINLSGGHSTTLVTKREGDTETFRRTPEIDPAYTDFRDENGERMIADGLLLVKDDGIVNAAAAPLKQITYSNVSSESYGITIASNKNKYSSNEDIYIKTSGVLSIYASDPWIGIYDTSAGTPTKDSASAYWAYPWNGIRYVDVSDFIINNERTGQDPNMIVTKNSSLKAGTYWIVIFGTDGKWAHVEITIQDTILTKVSDEWKDSVPKIKESGTWKNIGHIYMQNDQIQVGI